MRTKSLLIELEQAVPVAAFFLGHLLEDFCRVRITLAQVLGEGHVNAAVLLLGGDRDRKHLALGQIGKILHDGSYHQFRIILNYIGPPGSTSIQPLRALARNSSSNRLTSAGCSCCSRVPSPPSEERLVTWMVPRTVAEAVKLKAEWPDATLVAGGTFVGILTRQGLLASEDWISLQYVRELRELSTS